MAVKHIQGNEIENASKAKEKLALVDFSATWCGPCKMLDPVLKKISEELDDRVDFYHVDVDESPEASSQFGIRGVPTMIVFHDGEEIERMVGFRDRNTLQRQLDDLADEKLV
ncbi:MAG: thioredoxin [Candidatus Aegiribacteria sp.]|nr:thioredoxin [Candidatus Aegiribacteria sp.]MBD3295445.1 thioredoxin [Candidatus Fermentibacteria bacterium]